MLVDEVEITVIAGKGGPGKVSFRTKKGAGPDGGDGGKGGDVFAATTSDIYALNRFVSQNILKASDGKPGGINNKSGSNGKDLVLELPIGTVISYDDGTEIELNELDKQSLRSGDLKQILLAKGGLGGRGNSFFKSSLNTTPRYAQPGLKGGEKKLKLRLKLIADFGLIGLPNAGKSSLLNELTNANAKIGDYPFTTLEPNLGVIKGKVLADIPGLIEGASKGKGLGHKFLKHIEKVSLLLHCISSQSEDPLYDYKIVYQELKKYNPGLVEKEEIILLTKSDLVDKQQLAKHIKNLKRLKKKIIPISIHNWESLQTLAKELF